MAAYIKLVKLNPDGSTLDGQELQDYLIASGFAVPPRPDDPVQQYPTIPNIENDGNMPPVQWDGVLAQHTVVDHQICKFEYQAALPTTELQYTMFANRMMDEFGLYLGKKVPKIGGGYEYKPMQSINYNMYKAAQKLMGKYSPLGVDPIQFIAFNDIVVLPY